MSLGSDADAAFACVSTPGRAPMWEPHTRFVEPMDDGRPQVGQQYLVAHRVLGRALTFLYTMERLDPGKEVLFATHRATSTVRIRFAFDTVSTSGARFEDVGTVPGRSHAISHPTRGRHTTGGETVLVLTLQISLFGMAALVEPLVRWALRDVLDTALAGLGAAMRMQNPITGGPGS